MTKVLEAFLYCGVSEGKRKYCDSHREVPYLSFAEREKQVGFQN